MTPDAAAMIGLATLTDVGPRRLGLLAAGAGARERWDSMRAGVVPQLEGVTRDMARSWCAQVRALHLDDITGRYQHLGVSVHALGDIGFPSALAADVEPPQLLCALGDVSLLDQVGVAVVGTRRCSASGRSIARDLGGACADQGIIVVSGLALGIDGAAHEGVLAHNGAPIGVVASGLDVPYPSRHRDLWARVGSAGVLISESPLGMPPQKWRFPARNRIIAALSSIVVVVESGEHGGSMSTVVEALDRDRVVMAVPGPIHHAQSAGTNQLLAEGAHMCRGVDDVLAIRSLLGAGAVRPGGPQLDRRRPARGLRPTSDQHGAAARPGSRSDEFVRDGGTPADGDEPAALTEHEAAIMDAMGWAPMTFDDVAERSGLGIGAVAGALHSLQALGRVQSSNGLWERTR